MRISNNDQSCDVDGDLEERITWRVVPPSTGIDMHLAMYLLYLEYTGAACYHLNHDDDDGLTNE